MSFGDILSIWIGITEIFVRTRGKNECPLYDGRPYNLITWFIMKLQYCHKVGVVWRTILLTFGTLRYLFLQIIKNKYIPNVMVPSKRTFANYIFTEDQLWIAKYRPMTQTHTNFVAPVEVVTSMSACLLMFEGYWLVALFDNVSGGNGNPWLIWIFSDLTLT